MKIGDLVRYTAVYPGFEHQSLGIIIGGPNWGRARDCWKIWWIGQRNDDGSAKIGWWDDHRLEVISEGR